MAASMAILNLITSTRNDPDIETHHVSQTLRLVNQRLSSADATSDATIAVVVIIGQYHRHRGQYRDGLVHMNGLKRMVEMRGGISQILRESPMLGSKIIRLDTEYAVEWGSEPIFSTEEIMPASTAGPWLHERLSLEYSHRRPGLLQYRDLRSPELRSIATEMTTLAWLHNDAIAADRPKLTMRQSHEALLLVGYRLVHFSPLAGRRLAGDFEDAVHLGLVMFTVPFLHRLGGGIQDCPLLYELARSAAFSRFGVENREVLLWMLFVGRASVFTPRDEWLVSMVGRVLYDLSLYSWEEVLEVLGRFPWVGVLFDKAGKSLYDAATSVSETTG
ncbi:uncharacterized protein DNG_04467 [Cephalotrichum gorgonifer]|uniref:Uncharacterized protein n=1 Tax=Cephalotrichum gorgonifer TaxID=2041049 RepID=A0AAE8MY44_9PEZI|nr:uncharacterized protein DNG_04467 [Cephalotrichum gorgonifer]